MTLAAIPAAACAFPAFMAGALALARLIGVWK